MRLTDCREGDEVSIQKVGGTGSIRKRLLEMGFTKGAVLKIVKYAPLRDPLELLIKNSHVSLRISEASLLEVEVEKKEKEQVD